MDLCGACAVEMVFFSKNSVPAVAYVVEVRFFNQRFRRFVCVSHASKHYEKYIMIYG